MKHEFIKPTEKELEILQILWASGPVAVRDVHEAMGGDQQNGYTTILKLMQIMHEKGLVARQQSGTRHLYEALASQQRTRQFMVDKLISSVFQGSAIQLPMSALRTTNECEAQLSE